MTSTRSVAGLLFLAACARPAPPAQEPPPLDLSAARQGTSAAFLDLDGDGHRDKLVGAPWAVSEGRVGAVLVYPGTGDGFETAPAQRLFGPDVFGFSLLEVGDLDGDGSADLAISALAGSDEERSLTGTVTLYRGGARGEPWKTLSGGAPASKFGHALAAGDLDGDGRPELVVGAPHDTSSPAQYQGGSVRVFFSPDYQRQEVLAATPTHRGLGWAVAVGDLGGDGTADLIVGAAGEVLTFEGGPGFAPRVDAPTATLKSALSGFGLALAVPGDLDGDGRFELLVAAPKATVGGLRDTGSVFVVRGAAGARIVDLDASPAPAALLVRLDGPALLARFGASLAALGDIDRDGVPDFAVGAPLADHAPGDLAGKVFVFRGQELTPATTLASSTAVHGTSPSAGFGATLVSGGGAQLFIGAPRAWGDVGATFVVDAQSGQAVQGGVTGGASGGGLHCHDTHCE